MSSSSRADDHDRLRFLATPSPRASGAEKKESTDLRLNQACRPYATPSSISFFDRHLSDAHTAAICQSSAKLHRRTPNRTSTKEATGGSTLLSLPSRRIP